MHGRAHDARAMHTLQQLRTYYRPCYRPHAPTEILTETTTTPHAPHHTHVAFRISARTTNAPAEAPREEYLPPARFGARSSWLHARQELGVYRVLYRIAVNTGL